MPPHGRRAHGARPGRARRPAGLTSVRAPRRMSWQEPFQLLLEVRPGAMESRPHGAEREVERRRDLLVREALEVPEHDHDPSLLGQLGDRALERRLELAPLGVRRRIGVGPQALERLLALTRHAALPRGQAVQAEPRRDRVEPGRELGLAPEILHGPVEDYRGEAKLSTWLY